MRVLKLAVLMAAAVTLSGCLTVAGAAVGTAVGVTGAVVGTAAKGVGMAAGAVIPDGKDKDEDDS
jgi:hypothetical protein